MLNLSYLFQIFHDDSCNRYDLESIATLWLISKSVCIFIQKNEDLSGCFMVQYSTEGSFYSLISLYSFSQSLICHYRLFHLSNLLSLSLTHSLSLSLSLSLMRERNLCECITNHLLLLLLKAKLFHIFGTSVCL